MQPGSVGRKILSSRDKEQLFTRQKLIGGHSNTGSRETDMGMQKPCPLTGGSLRELLKRH